MITHCNQVSDSLSPKLRSTTSGCAGFFGRVMGEFNIHGHQVQLEVRRMDPVAAPTSLLATWQGVSGNKPLVDMRQIGGRPSYLGVMADDRELGMSLAFELVAGAWFWRQLQKSHALFVVGPGRTVRAFLGAAATPAPDLAELAMRNVLPAVEARRHALEKGRKEREAGLRLLEASGRLDLLKDSGESFSGTLAVREREGRLLAVLGDLEPSEAAALAEDLKSGLPWDPAQHGDLVVNIRPCGITVELGRSDELAARNLENYVAGFCRHVVLADLHLGESSRDTFGPAKIPALLDLLEDVIGRRSVLVLNGDILELVHERYGTIKRSYARVFRLLRHVRRVIYVAGNHDDEILRETIKETRRACREAAVRNEFAEVTMGLCDELLINPLPGHQKVHHQKAWYRILRDPRLKPVLLDILLYRKGAVRLSRGFASEGVAFKRRGARDTLQEQPVWHLDEHILRQPDPPGELARLMSNRRQRLDRVINADWGGNVEFVRYHWNVQSNIYFEHGHFGIPSCHGSDLGRGLSILAGWMKWIGVTGIEGFFEDRLGGWMRKIFPWDVVASHKYFIDRTVAVGDALISLAGARPGFHLVCSHTHEIACHRSGPVDYFLRAFVGGCYTNTGAWSSRLRSWLGAEHTVDWVEIDHCGNLRTCHAHAKDQSPPQSELRSASPAVPVATPAQVG